jgi:hypothetical protein
VLLLRTRLAVRTFDSDSRQRKVIDSARHPHEPHSLPLPPSTRAQQALLLPTEVEKLTSIGPAGLAITPEYVIENGPRDPALTTGREVLSESHWVKKGTVEFCLRQARKPWQETHVTAIAKTAASSSGDIGGFYFLGRVNPSSKTSQGSSNY